MTEIVSTFTVANDLVGISETSKANVADNDNYYDLQGRKMFSGKSLKKGLYIHNGKKVVMK